MFRRAVAYVASFFLVLCAVDGQMAQAAPITMPAGSTLWIELRSNACDADGDADCAGSNQLGANPAGGLPLTTSIDGTTHVTGRAEAYPDHMRSYLENNTGSFMWMSMQDTYTVHGTASGTFEITVHFGADGVASSISTGAFHLLSAPSVTVEIGTFNPSTDPGFLEQFRVTPFSAANTATWSVPFVSGPRIENIDVNTSYARTVGIGEVFSLAFGLNSSLSIGKLDLLNTASISFDLPEGVWLTSANGGTFGTPPVPVPAAVWLFGSALGLLGWLKRRAR